MTSITCPGLPASWINAWLAAVGTTQLDGRIRLQWTEGYTPVAVFSADGVHPVEALVSSWPTREQIQGFPLANRWCSLPAMERHVKVDAFAARVRRARSHPHSWTLSSTLTDLAVDKTGEVAHAPLDPAGPGTIKWLHHRLTKLHAGLEHSSEPVASLIEESLAGRARRVNENGLGFDHARLGSLADDAPKLTDPVIEVLAFFGLALLPVRGLGTDERDGARGANAIQRGWSRTRGERGKGSFCWPAWRQPLDSQGVDALLDVWNPATQSGWRLLGVQAGWKTLAYKARDSEYTAGFGSGRL